MTDTNLTPEDVRPGDPSRFATSRLDVTPEPRSKLEALGAFLAVVGFVVGIPAVLLTLAGVPSLPDSDSLRGFAQQLSAEDLVAVLVGIVWLAWLYFCVCLAVELVAALRGGVARRLPLAGPMQQVARVLIGAIVLTGVVAGPANAVAEASAAAPTGPVASVVMDSVQQTVTDAQGVAAAQALSDESVSDATMAEGTKVYTVKAPKDGYHDNLWDIAERHLGDGRRYAEIFELNKDREMSDGGRLELARLIQPGWELVMPDDAVGVSAAPTAAPQCGSRRAHARHRRHAIHLM